IEIFSEHSDTRFAVGRIFFRKTFIDMCGVEAYALILETFDDMLVDRPETFCRKRRSAKAILVANHDQYIIQFISDPTHVFKYIRIKLQFLPRIYLIRRWSLFDQSAVPADK